MTAAPAEGPAEKRRRLALPGVGEPKRSAAERGTGDWGTSMGQRTRGVRQIELTLNITGFLQFFCSGHVRVGEQSNCT